VALDMAKYRTLFLEEATEHLSEISGALLALEKDLAAAEPIDVAFRMAHSIKSMAASLEYDAVTELAHALEDRMEHVRAAGRVESPADMASLFAGLEGLEAMVRTVRESGEAPPSDLALVEQERGVPPDAFEALPDLVTGPEEADRLEEQNRLKKKLLS
jgi:two-component system chemotaxis sensor kinase CheA